ncbi:blr8090 [Bradyrhizobium diazoefficiens USDA 110]|uniref:Blr8090 protein n=1 Tax=Bradyrhizobium diazoefficiens (strain JCM 10833 / BCRC 13528 / IAM 13628 / NBRC 14792 / USDA 110) TaxID=224911 RepID=Q89BQ8_BRADU|nr:hypothetical protein [Bradyrhizobium diazoefficiens]QBP26818.1 hypothetical protein Bdiaspc4_42830 [Bradyrhizobium diazoefficiens]BAC53355.1 blr8090 [Bradyrhizobium diazoefficiens USDA 110]BCF48130.1 hypothetical protein XF16B_86200 [Bradyrhizobium diazoefficiens]BCF74291.1 hypothetical protein XF19B_86440 [Bradyrhizobium diazoefficiens]
MAIHRFETTARFVCPKCKRAVSDNVEVPEPSYEAERATDAVAEGPVEITCPKCETVFNGYCFNTVSSCEITLDDHGDTIVEAEIARYAGNDEDWFDFDTSDHPEAVFNDSYHHTGDLLTEHGGEGAHLVNRMVFSHNIGALESYLSDTLINLVSNDAAAMNRLLAKDKELKEKKFTLAEIASGKELVRAEVLGHLRSIVYHNIPRVRALYQIAADIDLFELLGDDKDKLFKAIEYRHDCVHRNGRDSKGNRLEVFSKAYVQETADLMRRLVARVEGKLHGFEPDADDFLPF